MREEMTEMKLVEVKIGHNITCNKCGTVVETMYDKPSTILEDMTHSFEVQFEYGSKHDGEKWAFHLCEECLIQIIKEFQVVPDGFAEEQYTNMNKVDRQKLFEKWAKQK